jgi:hypothetical protein
MKLEYVSFEDKQIPGDWRVEATNPENGETYIAIFAGPNAEARAVEYAAVKNGSHPIFKRIKEKPEPAPVSQVVMGSDEFVIQTREGNHLLVRPKEMIWRHDKRRGNLSARPRPPVETLPGHPFVLKGK